MNWTLPTDLRTQLTKLWNSGELLSGLVSGSPCFPKRLALKGPSSAEMVERFDEVRAWVNLLRLMPNCRVVLREFRHSACGATTVPAEVWIDTLDDALALIGRRREGSSFMALIERTRQRQPAVLQWLARRPLRALELTADWDRLLDVVTWLQQHPRPGIYLRQVDIDGVDGTFIDAHRGVLAEWLDLALPPSAIEAAAVGPAQFARRYGFRDKPPRIRFRALDPAFEPVPGISLSDLTLDTASFARLIPAVSRVFITENEINFLALPRLADSIAIFASATDFDSLAGVPWLTRCDLHYWGDIDTRSFVLLDQLRKHYAHVQSLLMDRATLLALRTQWSEEAQPIRTELSRLRDEEQALYQDLCQNRLHPRLRLDQERIGFSRVIAALQRLPART
jgi:hypothetical protein